KLQLRPYQQAAIDGLYDYWSSKRGNDPIIVAPTGAGKSLILAKLVEDALSYPGTRVLMLTHVKELIQQNAEELIGILPDVDLGFYSASLGQKRLDRQVTFAGIQSIWERAPDMVPPPDLVVIDEAHLVPKNTTTRYGKFLDDLRQCNPDVKIVGLTATPYRLDSGYLHKGEGAIFDGIAYDIPVGQLIDEGYLAPLVSKGAKSKIDLTNVGKRGGEFIESQLASAASDPDLVKATVEEIVRFGADRKSWLVFASGIEHAEMIRSEMEASGVDAEVVTGSDNKTDRARKIADFKSMRLRCLINIGVLTAGFNHPATDLVAMVRATASAGLYVQMAGRGTRKADGKEDCLLLDFGGNVERHGFIDAVRVKDKTQSTGDGEAPAKECPECQAMVYASLRVCPGCGHEFPAPEPNHEKNAYGGAVLSSQVQAEWVEVDDVTYQRHQKPGKPDSVRVTYHCGINMVNEWLCPDHGGYAASRYRARMSALGATAETTNDALAEAPLSWTMPTRIKIKPRADDPRFDEIVQLDYSEGRKPRGPGEDLPWDADEEIDYDEIPF
ncbi:MAG: DEAD/DEAH box helicase, partial [Spiribacter salinus]